MLENYIPSYLLDKINIKTFILIVVLYLLILYIALIFWTIKDINSRTDSIIFQVISIFLVIFFNVFGWLIYILIRPSKTIYEKFYNEVNNNLEGLAENVIKKIKNKNTKKLKS